MKQWTSPVLAEQAWLAVGIWKICTPNMCSAGFQPRNPIGWRLYRHRPWCSGNLAYLGEPGDLGDRVKDGFVLYALHTWHVGGNIPKYHKLNQHRQDAFEDIDERCFKHRRTKRLFRLVKDHHFRPSISVEPVTIKAVVPPPTAIMGVANLPNHGLVLRKKRCDDGFGIVKDLACCCPFWWEPVLEKTDVITTFRWTTLHVGMRMLFDDWPQRIQRCCPDNCHLRKIGLDIVRLLVLVFSMAVSTPASWPREWHQTILG